MTQTAASSARIYESRHTPPSPMAGRRIEVPTACADFPKEIIWSPRRWLEDVRAFFHDLREPRR